MKIIYDKYLLRAGITLFVSGIGTAWAGVNQNGLATMDPPFSQPDFFAIPNFTFSKQPEFCDGVTVTLNCQANSSPYIGGGIRKFRHALPGLAYDCTNPANQNDLGQCIPIATPDTSTFNNQGVANAKGRAVPSADYYSIEVTEYKRQLHGDISATSLRGFRQKPTVNVPAAQIPDSQVTPQYAGPFIFAQKGKPVRMKVTNNLQNPLPLPVDTSYAGAGTWNSGNAFYTKQNPAPSEKRTVVHLHGGDSPWINDGTPHQWFTPANDTVPNDTATSRNHKGWGFQDVPDMVASNCAAASINAAYSVECVANAPNDGQATHYYPNNLSDRMLWYHDHTFGITRLNVYAGEIGGYVVVDNAVEAALKGLGVPGTVQIDPLTSKIDTAQSDLNHLIPLIIQDKTFVPDNGDDGGMLAATDPTWPAPKNAPNIGWGEGNLWAPHVYMPNQLPFPITDNTVNPPAVLSTAPLGRWDYGPWFNPPLLANVPDVACSTTAFEYLGYGPNQFRCPGVPANNISASPEMFLDTPVVNGTLYPTKQVAQSAYRFRVLNGSNDRFWNLNLFYAYTKEPTVIVTDKTGAGGGAVVNAIVNNQGKISGFDIVDPGLGYSANPSDIVVTVVQRPTGPGASTSPTLGGAGATGAATVDSNGQITTIAVADSGADYIPPQICKDLPDSIDPSLCTEVRLEAAVPHKSSGFPSGASPAVCTGPKTMQIGQQGLVTAPVDGSGNLAYPGTGLPGDCWPNSWPADGNGRFGGIPNALDAGPAMIQIGTEGGILPKAVPIPPTPNGFQYDRRMATTLLVNRHGVWLAPAERADYIVDFGSMGLNSGKNSVFILYNDSVAPVPLFDPRYDVFTGAQDMTSTGGAPSTLPGYGSNIRTLMQFVVQGTDSATGTFNLGNLNNPVSGLPFLFSTYQERIIVPEPFYPPGNGYSTKAAAGTFNSFDFPDLTTGTIQSVTVNNPGNYDTAPLVSIVGNALSPALATATLSPGPIKSVTWVEPTPATKYTTPPRVTFNPTGATATVTLTPAPIASLTVTNPGANYATPVTVTVGGLDAGPVTTYQHVQAVTLTNTGGSGYVTAPAVTFSAPATTNPAQTFRATALGTAQLAATGAIDTVTGITSTCSNTGFAPRSLAKTVTANFSGGDGKAVGQATVTRTSTATNATARITSVNVSVSGSGYTPTSTMTVSGCTVSAATVNVARSIASITLQNQTINGVAGLAGGAGYTAAPTITIAAPTATKAAKVTATATAVMSNRVDKVTTAGSAAATSAPPNKAVVFSGGPGAGALATVTSQPSSIASITASGGGYATAPTATIGCVTGTTCLAAGSTTHPTATAILAARGISSIQVTDPGAGYTAVPGVSITAQAGDTGTGGGKATAVIPAVPIDFKGLIEGFDPMWGTLAIELSASSPLVANNPQAVALMPFAYADPPVDILDDGVPAVWRVDHIGVDTHAIHYHLVNAEIINSTDLAGQIYMPDANDLGYKETIKFNPFQSTFIAMRPQRQPNLPWELPTSIRPLEPAAPLGTVDGPTGCVNNPFAIPPQLGPNCVPFSVVDPQGNAVATTNALVNFGYEYVHHCHLLGHEEHDMMRPISFVVPPEYSPTGFAATVATGNTGRATLKWTDATVSETRFEVQQCFGPSNASATAPCPGTWTAVPVASNTGPTTGTPYTYQTAALPTNRKYWWRVMAVNEVGCLSNACSTPFAGWPSRPNNAGPWAEIGPFTH